MSYRLLKVMCQAVLVSEDEDGNLVENPTEPEAVSAKDWPGYSERLLQKIQALNNSQNGQQQGEPVHEHN